MVPIVVVAVGHLVVFRILTHQSLTLAGSLGTLGAAAMPFLVMMSIASVLLKGEGLDGRTIARKALQQPRWWRGWYPRPLRRRGDVWDRLPRQVRRNRAFWMMTLLSAFVFLVPLQVVLLRSGHSDVVRFVQYAMILTMLLGAAGIRRCSKYISKTFEMNINDARRLALASTSRVSFWHRTPSAMRLLGYRTSPAATANEGAVSPPTLDTTPSPR
jgi:Zn-dependent protease